MKVLKFSEPLPKLVLNRKKDITWRINDKRGIVKDDLLSLRNNDDVEFAKAKTIWVRSTRFKNLTKKDKKGHEKFSSDKEMYETYSRYYNIKVVPETKVKIIKFKLLD